MTVWPPVDEALAEQIVAEQVVFDLYAEAFRRWLPHVRQAVLPPAPITAAAGDSDPLPPPVPAGVEQSANWWAAISETVIVGGLLALWASTYRAACEALGVTMPQPPDPETAPDPAAEPDRETLKIVASATGLTVAEIRLNLSLVDATPSAADFANTVRVNASYTPETLAAQLTTTLKNSTSAELRAVAAEALAADSPLLRDYALAQSYDAAALQNHAALTAANNSDEPLEKVFIATLDAKTRKTHWAADGQRVPLDGKFQVGRARMDFPGDRSAPPEEWKNCRCRCGVLAPDEDIPDELDRHTERLDGRDSVVVNRDGRTQEEEIRRRAAQGETRARDERGRTASGEPALLAGGVMDTFRTFTDSVIGLVGQPTSDGRMLAAGIDLTFRAFPLPLMWCRQSKEGHSDSFTVGVIESARVEGDRVLASGYLLNSAEADEAAAQLAHGVTSPSVDLAAAEWTYTDENGVVVDEQDLWDRVDAGLPVLTTFTAAELIGTTLVATAAFGDTSVSLNPERESRDVALVAGAADDFRPPTYDHRLFDNPNLSGPTLPSMGEDGRIYGHLAVFGQCHRSIQTECVLVPRSPSGYGHFHTSPALRLDDGSRLPVGRLTVGTGHADPRLGASPAAAHYDNTGSCFGLVRVGEDKHGVWFSGVAAPWATAEQIAQGIASPLSGDWRDFGQGLDLVAALAVNTPGFAARGRDDDQGRPIALVASMGPSRGNLRRMGMSVEDVKAAVRAVLSEQAAADAAARVSAAEAVRRDEVLSRARDAVGEPLAPAQRIAQMLGRR